MDQPVDVSIIGTEGPGPPAIILEPSNVLNQGANNNSYTINIPPPKPPRVETQEALLLSNIEDHHDCSVITSVLCFIPVGLCAVHASRQVKRLLAHGDVHRAMVQSKRARLLNNLNICVGIALWMVILVVLILYFSGWIGNYYQEPLRPA